MHATTLSPRQQRQSPPAAFVTLLAPLPRAGCSLVVLFAGAARASLPAPSSSCTQLLQATVAAAEARDRSAAAATAFAALLHRYRRKRLRRGLQALGTAARAAAERRRKVERARLSAAMSQRAARTLLLTRCWGAWKAFATAGGLARR